MNDAVAMLNAIVVACCTCALTGATLIVYQGSKVLSDLGPELATSYFECTWRCRQIARSGCYFAVLLFVISYGLCLVGNSNDGTAVVTSSILLIGLGMSAYQFMSMKRLYNNQFHATGSGSSSNV